MNNTDASFSLSMKGTFIKSAGVWRVEIPVADFAVDGHSIIHCLKELDCFIKATSEDQKFKFTVKMHDGGNFSVSSSDYKAFIDFIIKRLISNPTSEDVIKELISGISIDIEF